jgi:hypothetical protein
MMNRPWIRLLRGFVEINSNNKYMTNKQEWYAIKDGNKYQNYGLCSDGLYHWEKDLNYAGYTAEEMIEMGAE